jgi:hypothetical protein
MRPAVKHRLVTLAAVASLLLCIATVALWVRSYAKYDVIARGYYPGIDEAYRLVGTELISYSGRAVFSHVDYGRDDPPPKEWMTESSASTSLAGLRIWDEFDLDRDQHWWTRAGFDSFFRPGDTHGPRMAIVIIPHWFLALLFATPPALRLWAMIHSRWLSDQSLCPACGYDLRATPERCPECGAAPVLS